MINKIVNIIAVCSVLTLGWGCSSDDDSYDVQTEKPNWHMDISSDDAAPDWGVTSAGDYEMTMSLGVKLNSALAQYASDDDLLAAFVGGVCRGVVSPSVYAGEATTLASAGLSIVGNAGDGDVTLKYYCKQLNRIFSLDGWMNFNPNQSPSQDGSAYVLPFEESLGVVSAQVTIVLPDGVSVDLASGDELALLYGGGKCCSSVAKDGEKQAVLNVLAPRGSILSVGWYCASRHIVYEAEETLAINNGGATTVVVTSFNAVKK